MGNRSSDIIIGATIICRMSARGIQILNFHDNHGFPDYSYYISEKFNKILIFYKVEHFYWIKIVTFKKETTSGGLNNNK